MENFVGKTLNGRHAVQELAGVGGKSFVYKAYDNLENRTVAVKVLKEEVSDDEELKRRIKKDFKVIERLSHPNIVKVYDVGFIWNIQYIVMEYVDNITLQQYITKTGGIQLHILRRA